MISFIMQNCSAQHNSILAIREDARVVISVVLLLNTILRGRDFCATPLQHK